MFIFNCKFFLFQSLRLIEGYAYSLFYVYILMRNLLVLRNDNRYGGTTDRNSREIFSNTLYIYKYIYKPTS